MPALASLLGVVGFFLNMQKEPNKISDLAKTVQESSKIDVGNS